MRVHGLKRTPTTLSGYVGDFELWFRVHAGVEPVDSADPFLVAALLPSMLDGSDVEVESPVSEALVHNLQDLQDIYHCWNRQLQKVAIKCSVACPRPPVQRVGSFYSGGVDSNHTFFRHEKEITDLIVVSGFDFDMSADTFAAVLHRLTPLAESFGKTLLPIETNFFQFERAFHLHRFLSHGSCLAANALMLGFRRVYIPSSHTYCELGPWGSHPLTDRLWMNGCTELVHDGAGSRRTEKLREIAQDQRILDRLVVCWVRPNDNCGVCGKCLRTMTAFRLLDITSPAVPPLTSVALVKNMRPQDATDVEFLNENLELAREKNDGEIVTALTAAIRRYHLRQGLIVVDDALLRGVMRRIYRMLHPPEPTDRVGFGRRRRWISDHNSRSPAK